MFAVVKTGGKQYKVAVDDVLKLEKIEAEVGQVIDLDSILLVGGADADLETSQAKLKEAKVKAKVLEQKRDKKVIIFKKKRRKNHRRKNGHRQSITVVKITEISFGGNTVKAQEEKKVAKPKKEEAKKADSSSKGDAKKTEAKKKAPAKPKKTAEKSSDAAKEKKAPAKAKKKAEDTKTDNTKDKE